MTFQELVNIGAKTTMRIGGQARFYGELLTKKDVEEAALFAEEKQLPLIVFGGGANTIFADGVIEAVVVRMKADGLSVTGNDVTVEAGHILGSLIKTLATKNLDLSPLTGIPGTVGGALFGNAGQGPRGIWMNHYVRSVTFFQGGAWHTWTKEQCDFAYRESKFKKLTGPVILWEATLDLPARPEAEVKADVERLLQKRIETQPHLKTAGSCFKALPDGTPAWTLIDAAGLRGFKTGGVQIAEKHANFLLNVGQGTFQDALALTQEIRKRVPQIAGIEMRLYGEDGSLKA